MSRTYLTAFALLLALASTLATRLFKAFTSAELLATGACIAGAALLLTRSSANALDWPHRLIVAGSLTGIAGLAVKLAFVLLGIGEPAADIHVHEGGFGGRVLTHIHHLFFNIGFLQMAAGAIGLLARLVRRQPRAT